MEFSLLDGGEDDEYNGIDFVEISKICATQDAYFGGTGPFDTVWRRIVKQTLNCRQHLLASERFAGAGRNLAPVKTAPRRRASHAEDA